MTKDLTNGSPMRLILNFTLPTLFGLLFQQFYNLVDAMIVGKLLGSQALGAVGSTGSINFFVIGFCLGEGVLLFGDEHYGTEFEICGLNNEVINSYSPEIFENRMWSLLDQTISIVRKEGD